MFHVEHSQKAKLRRLAEKVPEKQNRRARKTQRGGSTPQTQPFGQNESLVAKTKFVPGSLMPDPWMR